MEKLLSRKPQATPSSTHRNVESSYRKSCQAFISILQSIGGDVHPPSSDFSALHLEQTQQQNDKNCVSQEWLLETCRDVAKLMTPKEMATLIVEACKSDDYQSKLFEVLGADEVSMNLMFEVIAPKALEIAKLSSNFDSGDAVIQHSNSSIDPSPAELLREYEEAATLAMIAREEIRRLESQTVTKASDKDALKEAKAVIKRAAILKSKLPFQPEELDAYDFSLSRGESKLAPSGTKQFYEESKLPRGTSREYYDGYEVVNCPPPISSYEKLSEQHSIVLDRVMSGDIRKIFSGVERLNPMQSGVFEYAFKNRGNMLVCAPTGAGKTNVALLTVAAHLRDHKIISIGKDPLGDYRYENNAPTSSQKKKIVYVAPMKALAAEVTSKFSQKLKPLGLTVREFTGDTQLSKTEAERTDCLVTTPEKWDVVTRKGGVLADSVGLLIIDEVHLLAEERGSVIESLVARLHRHVETKQELCRIVGLSATLPSYEDVAKFLKARCFFFGPEYRPVPLEQTFVGVTETSRVMQDKRMKMVCLKYLFDSLKRGHQVLIFVHSRKATSGTLNDLLNITRNPKEMAQADVDSKLLDFLQADFDNKHYNRLNKRVNESRNREVQNLFKTGMGIHHAGMLRSDRSLTEEMFAAGVIKILCCTATLAWGVNLPAHTVIICGTSVFNAEKGKLVQLGILDVQQIFGRAGRPQFDKSGEAILITNSQQNLNNYLNLIVSSIPIESGFVKNLMDHLNAEIVASTVSTLSEAVHWLHYTYFYARVTKSPISYGISERALEKDASLDGYLHDLVNGALLRLKEGTLCEYDVESGRIGKQDLGRIASYYYVQTEAMGIMANELGLSQTGDYADVMKLLCSYTGFENVRVRPEELQELDLMEKRCCPVDVTIPLEEYSGKCCVLLQAYISRTNIKSFTLISDTNFLINSAERITRALFEVCVLKKLARLARFCLTWCNAINQRVWWDQSLLRHFDLPPQVLNAIETHHRQFHSDFSPIEHALFLAKLQPDELSNICKLSVNKKSRLSGQKIINMINALPIVDTFVTVHPINQSMVRLHVKLIMMFEWNVKYHGHIQSFWLFIEDSEKKRIYHYENITINKTTGEVELDIYTPVFSPMPKEYFVRILSDSWVSCEVLSSISLEDITLPQFSQSFTSIEDKSLLPVSVVGEPYMNSLRQYEFFNKLQTQVFDKIYRNDDNMVIAAPNGSGKGLCILLALYRLKKRHPSAKCVYVSPVEGIVRKRYSEWKFLSNSFGWNVVNFTSNDTMETFNSADVIMCSSKQWDSFFTRVNVPLKVGLYIFDGVHLISEEVNATTEAIITRLKHMSNENERIITCSETLACPVDFADWIGTECFYNFSVSSRPIQLDCRIRSFPGKHYVPRMNVMNKAIFSSIQLHSRNAHQQALVFVSSRAQTRSTAMELISHVASQNANDFETVSFLNCNPLTFENTLNSVSDKVLKHALSFGIGLVHNALSKSDRSVVKRMYEHGEIKVLISTVEFVWTSGFASLVIVKGTEMFDASSRRYKSYPFSLIAEMCTLSGRPGVDRIGTSIVMTTEDEKILLKRRLEENGFLVESTLCKNLCNFINVEVNRGTIKSINDAFKWINCSFFSKRLMQNPSYYESRSKEEASFRKDLIEKTIRSLVENECLIRRGVGLTPSDLGKIAVAFNLDYSLPKLLRSCLEDIRLEFKRWASIKQYDMNQSHKEIPDDILGAIVGQLLFALSGVITLQSIIPVRIGDEEVIRELTRMGQWKTKPPRLDVSFPAIARVITDGFKPGLQTKCFLLFQAHLQEIKLKSKDVYKDLSTLIQITEVMLSACKMIVQNSSVMEEPLMISIINQTSEALDKRYLSSFGPKM